MSRIPVIFENLSKRQQAYREVCERHFIEIGDDSNSGGEDAALYFTVLNDEGSKCSPEQEVEHFCLVTRGQQDIHYAYPDFETLERAQAKACENVDNDIYAEHPVEIVDLDTGDRYFVVSWNPDWGKIEHEQRGVSADG